MEQEEDYKQLQIKLKEAHQHLKNLNNIALMKAHKEVRKRVQDHFDMLAAVLTTRRDQLLEIVDSVFKQNDEQPIVDNISIDKVEPILNDLQQYSFDVNISSNSYQVRTDKQERKSKQCKFIFSEELIKDVSNYGQVIVDDNPFVLWKPVAVNTLAGDSKGSFDGVGSKAQFNTPYGMVSNPLDDCLYVCDYGNNMIRKVTQSGEVTKFVTLNRPIGICHYQKDNCFFVCEYGTHSVKRVSITGEIQAFAGTGTGGHKDGPSGSSQFNYPRGIDVDQQNGDAYVAEHSSHTIRKISQGQVSTVAGTPGKAGYVDGHNQSALFSYPYDLRFSKHHQALFVCDNSNNKLRKVSLNNATTSTACEVQAPSSIAILANGAILISSYHEHKLHLQPISGTGSLNVFAGTGSAGSEDGKPLQSYFNRPYGISVNEKTATCFIIDQNNHRIRAIKCV